MPSAGQPAFNPDPVLDRELLSEEYQEEHPETWYDPRIDDADTLFE